MEGGEVIVEDEKEIPLWKAILFIIGLTLVGGTVIGAVIINCF